MSHFSGYISWGWSIDSLITCVDSMLIYQAHNYHHDDFPVAVMVTDIMEGTFQWSLKGNQSRRLMFLE